MSVATYADVFGDITILHMSGGLDDVGALRGALADALGSRPQAVIVDLNEMRVGTTGARALLETAIRARVQGCRVVVSRAAGDDASAITGLPGGSRLPVFASIESATEGLLLRSGWL